MNGVRAVNSFSMNSMQRRAALTNCEIAEWWAERNLYEMVRISIDCWLAEVGKVYYLPPLQMVFFETEDVRTSYSIYTFKQAKIRKKRNTRYNEHNTGSIATGIVVEEFVKFCQNAFLEFLSGGSALHIFQRDKFAHIFTSTTKEPHAT